MTKTPKSIKSKKTTPKRPKIKVRTTIADKFADVSLAPSVARPLPSKQPKTTTVSLPKCTLKYALALCDPFSATARGACIPVGGSPSMKTHAFVRFDVTIGTGSSAMLYLTPSLANDCPSIYYTTSTYAGGSQPISTDAVVGAAGTASTIPSTWTSINHNGPFSAAQILGSEFNVSGSTVVPVSGKLVCAGLRVQYTGTTLNQSGLYYCYHDPSHNSLAGVTPTSIGQFGDTSIESITRAPCILVAHATTDEELGYSGSGPTTGTSSTQLSSLYPYSGGSSYWAGTYGAASSNKVAGVAVGTYVVPLGSPIGAIGITGVAGQTVHVEAVFHMEFTGTGAATMLTKTSSDEDGAKMVQTAALALPAQKLANPHLDTWSLMYSGLKEVLQDAVPYVVPAAKAALASILI